MAILLSPAILGLVLLALASTVGSQKTTVPMILSKGGELSFIASPGNDIGFTTSAGGKLRLNGVDIRDASSLMGPKGETGINGSKGDKGAAGDKGDKGAAGTDGLQGAKGEIGPAGPQGIQGVQGLQGKLGTKGEVGPAGRDGRDGLAGAKGDTGATGPKGEVGSAGKDGRDGSAGAKGDTGATGTKGEVGSTGKDGRDGSAGAKGDIGAKGTKGEVGSAGKDGRNGSAGAKGDTGAPGARGSPGPPGPSGGAVSSTCSSSVLPSCPFWLNMNVTRVPANGAHAVRFATSGFSELYHPYFNPSYLCRFSDGSQTVMSDFVSVTAVTDPKTRRQFYTIQCTPPSWSFTSVTKTSTVVNVSLWFLNQKEILFSGHSRWNQLTYFVQWTSARALPSSTSVKQLTINGEGFNRTAEYACRFTDSASKSAPLTTAAVQPSSTQVMVCQIPIYRSTTDTRTTIITTVSVWLVQSGKPVVQIPFNGSSQTYTVNRCKDAVLNGQESDVDCGGSCSSKCAIGKTCNSDSDCSSTKCDSSTKKCKSNCAGGWVYKGICLRNVRTSSSADSIPSGCNAYAPTASWTQTDYLAICQRFGGSSNCGNIDRDYHGGRCSNYRAILAYETNSAPDVWVNRNTFSFNPTSSSSPGCQLIYNPPGMIVYACK